MEEMRNAYTFGWKTIREEAISIMKIQCCTWIHECLQSWLLMSWNNCWAIKWPGWMINTQYHLALRSTGYQRLFLRDKATKVWSWTQTSIQHLCKENTELILCSIVQCLSTGIVILTSCNLIISWFLPAWKEWRKKNPFLRFKYL
jgi:hypothetical protein